MDRLLIIKSFFKNLEIHSFTFILAFLTIITGLFKYFLILFIIIILHELGHYLVACYYQWKVKKIILYPFGGLILFDEPLNKPLLEELFIILGGPFFQMLSYLVFFFFFKNNFFLLNTWNLYHNYHYTLLFFNLLPLYPLDGFKLFNIIGNYLVSFKKMHIISLFISFFGLSLIFFKTLFSFNLSVFWVFLFLLTKSIIEFKNHSLIFNKFLLERFLYNFSFKKKYFIKSNNLEKMKRDKKHYFLIKEKYIAEKEILRKRFQFSENMIK